MTLGVSLNAEDISAAVRRPRVQLEVGGGFFHEGDGELHQLEDCGQVSNRRKLELLWW
jgi:hypothetical protein